MNRKKVLCFVLAAILLFLSIWLEIEQVRTLFPVKLPAVELSVQDTVMNDTADTASYSGLRTTDSASLQTIDRHITSEDRCTQELLEPCGGIVTFLHSRTQPRLVQYRILRLLFLCLFGVSIVFLRVRREIQLEFPNGSIRIVSYIHAGDGKKRSPIINR